MTDPAPIRTREVDTSLDEGQTYSKDYWDLVLEQLRRRKLFRVGLVILALLYGVAIYAPFLANDRPYRFEGIDLRAYRVSLNALRSVASGMGRVVKTTDEGYLDELKEAGTLGADGVPTDRLGALRVSGRRSRSARARSPVTAAEGQRRARDRRGHGAADALRRGGGRGAGGVRGRR